MKHPADLGFVLTLALLATLPACRASLAPQDASQPAGEVLRALTTRAELSAWLDQTPERCLSLDPDDELCEWRLGSRSSRHAELGARMGIPDRIGILCVLPSDGSARADGSCTFQQRRSNRHQMQTPGMGRQNRGQSRARAIETRRDAARRHIDGARTLLEMSRSLGQLPERCEATATGRRCEWLLTDQTFGQGSVARLLRTDNRRKIYFSCVFPTDGGPRGAGSCTGDDPGSFDDDPTR